MTESAETERQVKGKNIVDLVKSLKIYRRNQPLAGLSAQAEALLDDRIIFTKWYSHETFIELMQHFYRHLLASNPENAVKAGILTGYGALQEIHRGFIKKGDPVASLYSLRHIWVSMYNYGKLDAEPVGENSVRFVLADYPDIPEVHGMLTVGWGIAAAQLAGSTEAYYTLKRRPWQEDPDLVYLIHV